MQCRPIAYAASRATGQWDVKPLLNQSKVVYGSLCENMHHVVHELVSYVVYFRGNFLGIRKTIHF